MLSTTGSVVNTECTSLLVTEYPANYKIVSEDQVFVFHVDIAGNETLLLLTTDYSIDSITETGFVVTLVTGYETGSLSVRRIVPRLQETEFVPGGDFPADAFEDALDRLMMIVQEQWEVLNRAIVASLSDEAVNLELPPVVERAGKFAAFDDDGNVITKVGTIPATEEISAADIPIVDVGDIIIAIEVEGALQEIQTALDIVEGEVYWDRIGTVLSPKNAGDDVSLEFGDLVSEQNPDGYGAIRLKGTESDVDIVLGAFGYFNIWNVTDSTPNDNVFCVDDSGNTVIHGYLDMNSNQINELTDPTLDQDAATKKYVDDNNSDNVDGPVSTVDNRIAQFNGVTGKIIEDSGYIITDLTTPIGLNTTHRGLTNNPHVVTAAQAGALAVAGKAADSTLFDGAALSIDGTLAGDSDTDVPTEKAVKTYVDSRHTVSVSAPSGGSDGDIWLVREV